MSAEPTPRYLLAFNDEDDGGNEYDTVVGPYTFNEIVARLLRRPKARHDFTLYKADEVDEATYEAVGERLDAIDATKREYEPRLATAYAALSRRRDKFYAHREELVAAAEAGTPTDALAAALRDDHAEIKTLKDAYEALLAESDAAFAKLGARS